MMRILLDYIRRWQEWRVARAAYRRGYRDGKQGLGSHSCKYPYQYYPQANFAYRVGYTRAWRKRVKARRQAIRR